MWSYIKCHTLDVWDWICGNKYPRQEKLDLLRRKTKVDSAANSAADSTVSSTVNVIVNTKANIIVNTKAKFAENIAAMDADWNDYLKESPDKVNVPEEASLSWSSNSEASQGLKKSSDKVNVPTSGVPTSGVPTSGVPTSGVPTSGVPTSGVPTLGLKKSSDKVNVPTSDVPTLGLKKSSDKVNVELKGLASDAIDPRSPRPDRRIVNIIRQPSFLCWTETHPQGSMCATSYVRGHQEF